MVASDKKVSLKIDWISSTWDCEHSPFVVFEVDASELKEEKPMFGYSRCRSDRYGFKYLTSENKPTHLIASGQALTAYRLDGGTDFSISEKCLLASNISRVDFAVDVVGDWLFSPDVAWAYHLGGFTKTASKVKGITSPIGIETMYVGSLKNKTKLLRIYDKRKERVDAGEEIDYKWTRIEIEVRKNAYQWLKTYHREGDIRRAIRAFFDIDNDTWLEIMGKSCEYIPESIQIPAFRKWLYEQIAPSISAYMKRTGDYGLLDELWQEIQINLMK